MRSETMSALTSPGLVSPPAAIYSLEAFCHQVEETQTNHAVAGRTMDVLSSTAAPHLQNVGNGGDSDSAFTPGGHKSDAFSIRERNFRHIMEQDYDEEMSDSDDYDDDNEGELIINEEDSSVEVKVSTATATSENVIFSVREKQSLMQPKRNKRKNFKPRNIFYSEDMCVDNVNSGQCDIQDVETCGVNDIDAELERRFHSPLDLSESASERTDTVITKNKNRRKPVVAPQRRFISCSKAATSGVPMDLSFPTKNENNNYDTDNDTNEIDNSVELNHLCHSHNVTSPTDSFRPNESNSESNGSSEFHFNSSYNDPRQCSENACSQHESSEISHISRSHEGGVSPVKYTKITPTILTPEQVNSQYANQHHPQGTDASAMKEYAENTMKELLSIYGLNSPDMAETIIRNVPIANFSSGKILETLSPKHIASTQQHFNLCLRSSRSPPSQPPTPPRTPISPANLSGSPVSYHQTSVPANTSHSHHAHKHGEQTIYENIRHKMVDSMTKLAGMQSNPVVNPRIMLPQNMATILTLAALQEQQTKSTTNAGSAHRVTSPHLVAASSPSTGISVLDTNKSGSALLSSRRMSPLSPVRESSSNSSKASVPVDYSRYVKRFSSSLECGSAYCKDLNYREHFHCLDCNSRVFVKKEEMIRHFKWHKKRDESLQHGFLRYSPMDDCSDRYRGCSHNRKQTHYHCIKDGCDKVYISTSDVQMHANYHRKDSAIIQEGFQRFRATEECGAVYCSFFGQRTTHFHCRRDNCKYTFKNKADMEKHKTYHIKDEQLSRDGFKKFMKHESCPFESCRFSRVCNHIHCIRSGCNYVLHSSGQLFSHKRKHERQDSEMAYRKFKLAQSMMKTFGDAPQLSPTMVSFPDQGSHSETSPTSIQTSVIQQGSSSVSSVDVREMDGNDENSSDGEKSPISNISQSSAKYSHSYGIETSNGSCRASTADPVLSSAVDLSTDNNSNSALWCDEDFWQKFIVQSSVNEKCVGGTTCEFIFKEHFHCVAENCELILCSMDGVKEHARNHEQQEQVTEAFYVTEQGLESTNCQCDEDCPYQNKEKHYHCTWDNCREIILPSDKPFRRLDHYKMHEYSRKLSLSRDPSTTTHLTTTVDGMFRRKRGRPPKNRVIEVWNDCFPLAPGSTMDSPQAIFTSFKLPKPSAALSGFQSSQLPISPAGDILSGTVGPDEMLKGCTQHRIDFLQEGFYAFPEGTPCPDVLCPYNTRNHHYHCSKPRCFYVTDREDILIMHSKDFHDNIDIMEGFLFFDRMVDCRLPSCISNKINRHFHCVRPGCGYSFVRYSAMAVHEQKHLEENTEITPPVSSHQGVCRQYSKNSNEQSDTPEVLENSQNASPVSAEPPSVSYASSPDQPSNKTTVVKASGTFYPLSAFSCGPGRQNLEKGGVSKLSRGTSPSPPSPNGHTDNSPELEVSLAAESAKLEPKDSIEAPLLERQTRYPPQRQEVIRKTETSSKNGYTRFDPDETCSRPFCKLKKKEHYHCNFCNQAFTELERMKPHIAKHGSGNSPTMKRELEDNNNDESNDSSIIAGNAIGYERQSPGTEMLSPIPHPGAVHSSMFPPHSSTASAVSFNAAVAAAAAAAAAGQQFALMSSQGIPFIQPGIPAIYTSPSTLMFAGPHGLHPHHPHLPSNGLLDHHHHVLNNDESGSSKHGVSTHHLPPGLDMSPEAKKARVQSSMRILKDEPVPEGYIRFRFNEDCKYPHCGYREHQTHFHCMRSDCGYSFCDKTRFVQHTARHERLDTLMGGDFQQFRANVSCGRHDCVYTSSVGAMQNKASHFHCLKCEFVCTDTNKVVAHRRQHQKLDSIMAAGFEKFTPSQPCNQDTCAHSGKQTHYHCLSCQYAVLGLSQMSAHKYRHME